MCSSKGTFLGEDVSGFAGKYFGEGRSFVLLIAGIELWRCYQYLS